MPRIFLSNDERKAIAFQVFAGGSYFLILEKIPGIADIPVCNSHIIWMRSIDKINEDLMPIACFSVRLHIARYSERSSQIVFSGKDSKHTVAVIVVAKFGNQEYL